MKLQSLLVATLTIASLHAQDKPADPYRETKAGPAPAESNGPRNISICYETFSLPLAMAAKLQRELTSDSELYTRIVAAVEKQTARQESFTVLRAKSGQKALSESISEQMFPNEYEPPELPNSVGVTIVPPDVKDVPTPVPDTTKLKDAPSMGSFEAVKTPATPTSFQKRNIGVTFEIEPTTDDKGTSVELRMLPGHVALVGRSAWGQGLSTSELPVFETQSIQTSSNVRLNQPFLIGTLNRTPDSKVDPDSANRVWFAFVTASFPKP
jgi:hypothetical protein